MDLNSILESLEVFVATYAMSVVGAILTLIIGFIVINWVTRVIKQTMEKRGIEISLRSFLGSIVSIGLRVLLLLSVAGMFGIEVTSFIAIFSALAFSIGLALHRHHPGRGSAGSFTKPEMAPHPFQSAPPRIGRNLAPGVGASP